MLEVNITNNLPVITDPIYQFDTGHKIEITGINKEVVLHLLNKKSIRAVVISGTYTNGKNVFNIPDVLVAEPYDIIAYICEEDDLEGKTLSEIVIPIIMRVRPDNY